MLFVGRVRTGERTNCRVMERTGNREQRKTRHGFILATIGSAVGLGNIWRFSYIAVENGGAIFLLLYLDRVVLIGLPLVIAELALGRRAQGDAIAAFDILDHRSIWRFTGWIGTCGAVFVLSYYAVIAGWALKYFVGPQLELSGLSRPLDMVTTSATSLPMSVSRSHGRRRCWGRQCSLSPAEFKKA